MKLRKQTLRWILGGLAFVLPLFLPLVQWMSNGDPIWMRSLSVYYYSDVYGFIMVILLTFGFTFLLYGLTVKTNRAILLCTGIVIVCLTFIPTYAPGETLTFLNYIHILCALILFGLLGCVIRHTFNLPMSFPMLTKIGTAIWVVMAVLFVYFLVLRNVWPYGIYLLETIILWLFAAGIYVRNQITRKLSGK